MVNSGLTVSDILGNDFETVMGIINSSNKAAEESVVEEKPGVMSLGDFMKIL